uniref:SOCS box domain-containing protein n=1 Tax=Branchiostoma floridae TaxID=7739 RepID=C4A101_BRAFL|eukprot:XP_002585519.1 hypothetical protein BRAFLDRAFT_133193 [Branchiostoma floridae]
MYDSGSAARRHDLQTQTKVRQSRLFGSKQPYFLRLLWMKDGDCDKIRSLLEGGMDVDAEDDQGCTALHHAAKAGHCPAMEVLLDRGADIDVAGNSDLTPGKTGLTALHLAAMNSHCAAISLLLNRGADVDKRNMLNQTALHFAISRGNCDLVGLLVHENFGFCQPLMDKHLLEALQHSSVSTEGDHDEACSVLLAGGADIGVVDHYGCTLLHYAAFKGNNDAILLLLDRGADLDARNTYGHFLLHSAALGGHNDTINLLLDRDVDIEAEDFGGRTALHFAAQYGHHKTVQLLCSRGGDLTGKDKFAEMTPLLLAAQNGHCDVIDVALSLGATFAEEDVLGNKVLHFAVLGGWMDAVTHLLDLGIEVNARNEGGATALHYAVYWKECSLKMAEVLLLSGADCNVKDIEGRTLVDVALEDTGMQKFLLHHLECHPNLKRLCRRKILSVLGKSGQEESDVHQFTIPQDLKDYLLFRAIY